MNSSICLSLDLTFPNDTNNTWDTFKITRIDSAASILVIIINSLGVLANILMMRAIMAFPLLKKCSSFILILHCTLADTLNCFVIPTNSFLSLQDSTLNLPKHFCLAYVYFALIPGSLGLYANCSLAIQRLLAVIIPHNFKHFTTPKASTFFIAIPWTVCLIMSTFLATDALGFVMIQKDHHPSEHCFIQSTYSWPLTTIFLYIFIQMHVPFATIGGCYLVLFITTLKQIRRERRKPSNDRRVEALVKRLDISRGLFVCYLWHIVGGYQFIYSAGILPDLAKKPSIVRAFLRVLASSYSAMSPVFLFLSSRIFRSGIKHALGMTNDCEKYTKAARVRIHPAPVPSSSSKSDKSRQSSTTKGNNRVNCYVDGTGSASWSKQSRSPTLILPEKQMDLDF